MQHLLLTRVLRALLNCCCVSEAVTACYYEREDVAMRWCATCRCVWQRE